MMINHLLPLFFLFFCFFLFLFFQLFYLNNFFCIIFFAFIIANINNLIHYTCAHSICIAEYLIQNKPRTFGGNREKTLSLFLLSRPDSLRNRRRQSTLSLELLYIGAWKTANKSAAENARLDGVYLPQRFFSIQRFLGYAGLLRSRMLEWQSTLPLFISGQEDSDLEDSRIGTGAVRKRDRAR